MQTSKLFISFLNIKGADSAPNIEYSLNTNDVIIYSIYLPNFINLKSDLANFLNATDLKKAAHFHNELDRTKFIIYRSILKFVIAAHTKLDAKNINFHYDINKKPYLASHPWLYFNISHSQDFAVVAISSKRVGIDIEYSSENFDFESLVPEIFDCNEILTIQNSTNKKNSFYNLWTRKEALVKALGKGIDEDFKYIPCLDGEHSLDSKLIKNDGNWQVYSFELADQYPGAIAFEVGTSISKKIAMYSFPNTMKDLLKMVQY
jgi:4'-phosphopantetheinyl transferase